MSVMSVNKIIKAFSFFAVFILFTSCDSIDENRGTVSVENMQNITVSSENTDTGLNTVEDEINTVKSETETGIYDKSADETSGGNIEETSAATEIITESTVFLSETSKPANTIPAPDIKGYKNIGESGILVTEIGGKIHALMPCWGTYTLCDKYAKNMNDIAARLPEVDVYSMVIPTAAEFYLPPGNEGFSSSQLTKINYITEELVNITNVDVYKALRSHTGEDIYARTDHHWQPLGAYYAARAFSETADFPFVPLEDYRKVVKNGYVGSMYGYTNDANILNDPEDFTMYIPPDTGKTVYYDESFKNGYENELFLSENGDAYYCSFLGSDTLIAEIKTNAGTGRTLVIFKESYGNALVPFLISGFDTIYVCDIRYFDLNAVEFCKNAGATDLIFAVCTFTAAGENGLYLEQIK